MPVVEQAESTINIGGKLLSGTLAGIIAAVALIQTVQIGGQPRQHLRSSVRIRELCADGGNRLIKICPLGIGTRNLLWRIVKAVIDGARQPFPFILRDLGNGILARKAYLGDQALIGLDHIGDGQPDLIILLTGILPLIR